MFKNKKLNVFADVLATIARLVLFAYCAFGIVCAVKYRSVLGVIIAAVLAGYYIYGLVKDLIRIIENYGKEKSDNVSAMK